MTPTRVAYVVRAFPRTSGRCVAAELAELRRRGIEVRVLSLETPEEPVFHAIVAAGLVKCTTYEAQSFAAVLDAFRPDVVHAHLGTEPAGIACSLACALRRPFTFTAHGCDACGCPAVDLGIRARDAAAVVTVSEVDRHDLDVTHGVAADRVHVIPCGVDTEWFTPGIDAINPPLVVCVAPLRESKRLDVLFRACALLRDSRTRFRCVIVGDGPERDALERLRRQLRLETLVELSGLADPDAVRLWWQRASIAALSSQSEDMPVSLMEAAACGVPAVAPAVGGIPELIVDGVTGFVTPPLDSAALADALRRLITDVPLRLRMRAAARERAECHFSRVIHVDRLLAMWSSIRH